jgi:hypothetical protein
MRNTDGERAGRSVRSSRCNNIKTVMKRADLCLVRPGGGRITLQKSAERLDQLRVTVHPEEAVKPIASKASAEASEANSEIASENDQRSA